MGRKNKNLDKEYTREQKYKKENQKLKRENARLKKIIARIDLEEFDNLKEAVLKHEEEDKLEKFLEDSKKREESWKCWDCQIGILRIKILEIKGGAKYYRKCDNCPKRTKGQKYTKDVDGV